MADFREDQYRYKAGTNPVYQPGNPSVFNRPVVQGVQSFVNANDFTYGWEASKLQRYPNLPTYPVINLRNNQYTPLDANTNAYNPRRYPDPSASVTAYPVRRTRKPPMNGSVCAYNPLNPIQMPASGTNDVAFIVQVGM